MQVFEGEYYGGDEAWEYLKAYSELNSKAILTEIANERTPKIIKSFMGIVLKN